MENLDKKATKKVGAEADHGDDMDRVRFVKVNVMCPECLAEKHEKIKFSLSKSIPNLINCGACGNSFILIQRAEIRSETIELKKAIDEANAKFEAPAASSGSKKGKKAAEAAQDPFQA